MGELIKVVDKKDVAPGSRTAVEVRGQKVAAFNVDGTFYAIGDTSLIAVVPLSEGDVSGTTVTCSWHKAQYQIFSPQREGVVSFELRSSAFQHNLSIPTKYTCDGANVSAPLSWTDAPRETKSFALIVDAPDAPTGVWALGALRLASGHPCAWGGDSKPGDAGERCETGR